MPLERKNDAVSKRSSPSTIGYTRAQYHLRQMASAVAPRIGEICGQEVAELQHSQKLMEEVHAAVVSETRMITGDSDITGRIRHFTNS